MANPLYNAMKQNNPLEQLAQQAREFQKQFKGNPREEVQKLLNSGNSHRQILTSIPKLHNK